MRKKTPPGLTFDVPHEALLASYEKNREGWLALADRIERGDCTLNAFERETIAIGLREYVKTLKPPARPRGARPKFDAGEAALQYGALVNAGVSPAEAIGQLADARHVSEQALRAAIRPMVRQAPFLARVPVKPET